MIEKKKKKGKDELIEEDLDCTHYLVDDLCFKNMKHKKK